MLAVPLALSAGLAATVAPGLAAPSPQAAQAATAPASFEERMEALFDDIETEYRPGVRWWLAEGLNTDETLKANVKEIADSGFGEAEFLAMPEPGAPDDIYGWGSQEWTHDSRLVMEEAVKRDLGFSLTSGTHWATANLPDTWSWQGARFDLDNKASSQELNYSTVLLNAGERHNAALPRPVLPTQAAAARVMTYQGVVAAKITTARTNSGQANGYREGTGTGNLDFSTLVDLSDRVVQNGTDYTLDWTAPADGQYALFTYWMHGTGQLASPSVSKNYTINYIDKTGSQALKDYWEAEVLTPDLKELIRSSGRGEMYMDSLEIASYAAGGMLWGYDFLEEFKERRGYDVRKYLPLITWDAVRHNSNRNPAYDYAVSSDSAKDELKKIRFDMAQTYSELYEQNVLKPIQEWLHGLNMKLRAEPSYGYTYEISTPGKYLDGIETETFAHNGDLDVYRGLVGSAHMYDRPFSSETGAVGGRNMFYNMDHWTQIALMQMAGGVNRVVWHGYSGIEGSAADTKWPGHEGMSVTFSDRFNSRMPASSMYPEWNEMLGRNQKILRQGQPQRDIAILRTDNAFISYGQPSTNTPPENNYFANDQPYFWKDLGLQHNGYTYDYFSPQLLEDEDNVTWTDKLLQPDGPSYKAMVLYQEALELDSAKKLLEVAKDGIPVVFVNNTSEIQFHLEPDVQHAQAASKSRSRSVTDAEVKAVVDQIKALPNVKTVENQADTMATLKSMGVTPRVGYAEPNNKLMTVARLDKDEQVLYTYAHSFKFAKNAGEGPSTFELVLEGAGKPYAIDDATGDVTEVGTYRIVDGRTHVQLTVKPGEARVIALDLADAGAGLHAVSTTADEIRSTSGRIDLVATKAGTYDTELSDGSTVSTTVEVPAAVTLPKWDLKIEDWNEGDRIENTEEKFGHTTTEVYYTTKKTPLNFPDTDLVSWKDLPATQRHLNLLTGPNPSMADVSGVGTYTTSFKLPADWDKKATGAVFSIGSANGGSTEVYVNGRRATFLDLRSLKVDVSNLVKPGTNQVRVVTTTTLTNRLLKRGYRTRGPAQDYGITGEAKVTPYTVATVDDGIADPEPEQPGPGAVDSKVAADAAAGVYGKDASIAVRVSSEKSTTGSVTVTSAAGAELDTARVVNGIANIEVHTTDLGAGTHTLRLDYDGNAETKASTGTATLTVAKATTSLRATATPKKPKIGKTVKVTVRVRASDVDPEGRVVARINGKKVGAGKLRNGTATIKLDKLNKLGAGKKTITLIYKGDANIEGSRTTTSVTVRKR
nr:glycosyl hydrolase [uncultured Nocardioides sp.]